MSAYIVDKAHIDYLVAAVAKARYTIRIPVTQDEAKTFPETSATSFDVWRDGWLWEPHHDLDTLGRILWAENAKSVMTRYPGEPLEDMPGPRPMPNLDAYTFDLSGLPDTDNYPQVIKAVGGWQYQTCEYDGHEEALGWRVTEVLYRLAADGLARGEWSITRD